MSRYDTDPLPALKPKGSPLTFDDGGELGPDKVVEFSVVGLENVGEGVRVHVLGKTREGFKLYERGLIFEFQPKEQFPFKLPYSAEPKAQTQFDKFTNKIQSFFSSGTHFKLHSPMKLDPQGGLLITVQSCSLTKCLLPSTFYLGVGVGSVSQLKSIGLPQGTSFVPVPEAESPSPGAAHTAPQSPAPYASTTSTLGTTEFSTSLNFLPHVESAVLAKSPILFPTLILAGLALNLTPCIYPMIPITLNTIGFLGNAPSGNGLAKKAVPIFYSLGILVFYTLLGLIAGLTGSLFGSWLQSPWVNLGISVFLFFMGFAMLGFGNFYRLQQIAYKVPIVQSNPRLSAFLMGGFSAFISAPCTGPVLSLLLVLIGNTKDPVYGSILMVFFSSGFALPYLILGLGTQKAFRMPHAPWLINSIKYVFASLLFSLSVIYLRNLSAQFPYISYIFMKPTQDLVLSIASVFTLSLIFLLTKPLKTLRLLPIAAFLCMTALFTWLTMDVTSSWAVDTNPPSQTSADRNEVNISQPQIHWLKSFKKGSELAKKQQKPLLVDLWAQWCSSCLEMDHTVWVHPEVIDFVNKHFVAVKLDFTTFSLESQEISKLWKILGLPAIGLYKSGETHKGPPSVVIRESVDPDEFIKSLEAIQKQND